MNPLIATFAACLIASAAFLPPSTAPAKQRATETVAHERELPELAFLSGTWRGEMNGEFVEEIWSAERGGAMMGMFRWLAESGGPRMYELLTINREGDDVFLRLRHFNAAMVGWASEKDGPVVLKLRETGARRAAFVNVSEEGGLERIVFRSMKDAGLAIDVEFRAGTNSPPLNFQLVKE